MESYDDEGRVVKFDFNKLLLKLALEEVIKNKKLLGYDYSADEQKLKEL